MSLAIPLQYAYDVTCCSFCSSSCSPGSTLSGKHSRNTDRHGAQSDGEPTHPHRRRHSLHNRARSHDQSHYSDTESVTQKRPPSGPVYTAPHNQGYNSGMSGTMCVAV